MTTKVTTSARVGVVDTVRCAAGVLMPMFAQGVIRRRDRVVRLAQRLDLDRRGADVLHRLRHRHGPGPLLLSVPGRSVAVVLEPSDVERLLTGSPDPFAPATTEKVAALRHFQPHGVLLSTGAMRAARRRVNERALDTGQPLHRVAGAVAATVRDEVDGLDVTDGMLDWATFGPMFDRVIRRVVLGDSARDDTALTADLNRLRNAANWAYLRPRNERLRARFQRRIDSYAARAEAGSLVGAMAGVPTGADGADPPATGADPPATGADPATEGVDPAGQVPHWLFAFDAARITAMRTLALLGSDPGRAAAAATDVSPVLPYLRACVLDTVRLWPTTLVVLRESTADTDWHGTTLRGRTTFVIPSAFHHRDPTAAPHADEFSPEDWLDGEAHHRWSVFPFSAGPAVCPGRDVVLLTVSTLLFALLQRFPALHTVEPLRAPLPATLDHTGIRLATTLPGQ
jgi:cytochrome P450